MKTPTPPLLRAGVDQLCACGHARAAHNRPGSVCMDAEVCGCEEFTLPPIRLAGPPEEPRGK